MTDHPTVSRAAWLATRMSGTSKLTVVSSAFVGGPRGNSGSMAVLSMATPVTTPGRPAGAAIAMEYGPCPVAGDTARAGVAQPPSYSRTPSIRRSMRWTWLPRQ